MNLIIHKELAPQIMECLFQIKRDPQAKITKGKILITTFYATSGKLPRKRKLMDQMKMNQMK